MYRSPSRFAPLGVVVLGLMLTACEVEPADDAAVDDVPATATAVSDEPGPDLAPGTYQIDPSHSEVGFRIRHLGISHVEGTFNEVTGTVTAPSDDLADMEATAVIRTASIDTQNEDRDNHLRSGDFFEAETYPEITFRSTSVEPLGGGRFRMNGDLTMRGVTNPIVLEGEYAGSAPDGFGNNKVGFMAEGTIDRKDWGLTWNKAIETGGVVVGDEVTMRLDVQAGAPIEVAEAGTES